MCDVPSVPGAAGVQGGKPMTSFHASLVVACIVAVSFVGCASPPPTTQTPGNGFIRLRWGGGGPLLGFNASTGLLVPITGTVKSITILFDEGTDTGPDNFGLAVIDNIDVNGVLVGRGDNGND